ncbi:hypothetical protein PAL_GLEAN10014669 [Pteropus alecto]|uniref:Uncharacterized protein n=1 Tax=Pteropus alecto TaxID=9402 RepID=L5KKZ7_PTEAL|nr:hypothetical protein PAL_GLEAN10014669 [Pteropus alecto]
MQTLANWTPASASADDSKSARDSRQTSEWKRTPYTRALLLREALVNEGRSALLLPWRKHDSHTQIRGPIKLLPKSSHPRPVQRIASSMEKTRHTQIRGPTKLLPKSSHPRPVRTDRQTPADGTPASVLCVLSTSA